MPHKSITYRRSDLYAQVWAEPMRNVAKRHGVSDVALAKTCRKHDIPVPGRGYWARIAAGHFDDPTPLPALPEGGVEEWEVRRWVGEIDRTARPPKPVPPEIAVAATLHDPHELVAAAKKLLSHERPDEDGFLASSDSRCLRIRISPAELDRALRIADAFIKACEARGMRIELAEEPGARSGDYQAPPRPVTRVLVDAVSIELRLFEHYRVVHTPAPKPPKGTSKSDLTLWAWTHPARQDREPNGRLELQISAGMRTAFWRDRQKKPLQLRLGQAMVGMPELVAQVKADEAEATRRREEFERQERRRALAERKAARRRERDEKVLKSLQAWRTARDLREFAADARKIAADGLGVVNMRSGTGRLVRWAALLADRMDPFTPLRQEIAADIASGREVNPDYGSAQAPVRNEEVLVADLRRLIGNWREAQAIREHVAACAAVAAEAGLELGPDRPATQWLKWASQHADRIDPVARWRADVDCHVAGKRSLRDSSLR